MNKIREICSLRLKEMSKFVAKYGGYCRKLGKNMVDIDGYMVDIGGYLADIHERV